jgi:hypothetical protein
MALAQCGTFEQEKGIPSPSQGRVSWLLFAELAVTWRMPENIIGDQDLHSTGSEAEFGEESLQWAPLLEGRGEELLYQYEMKELDDACEHSVPLCNYVSEVYASFLLVCHHPF